MGVYRRATGTSTSARMTTCGAAAAGWGSRAGRLRVWGALARVKNRRELDALLEGALAGRTAAEWVERLNEAGVACGPIYTLDQVFADPQVKAASWSGSGNEAGDRKGDRAAGRCRHAGPGRAGRAHDGRAHAGQLEGLGYDAATSPRSCRGVIQMHGEGSMSADVLVQQEGASPPWSSTGADA